MCSSKVGDPPHNVGVINYYHKISILTKIATKALFYRYCSVLELKKSDLSFQSVMTRVTEKSIHFTLFRAKKKKIKTVTTNFSLSIFNRMRRSLRYSEACVRHWAARYVIKLISFLEQIPSSYYLAKTFFQADSLHFARTVTIRSVASKSTTSFLLEKWQSHFNDNWLCDRVGWTSRNMFIISQ